MEEMGKRFAAFLKSNNRQFVYPACPYFVCSKLPRHLRKNKALPEALLVFSLNAVDDGTLVHLSAANELNASVPLKNATERFRNNVAEFQSLRFAAQSGRARTLNMIITVESYPPQVFVYPDAIKISVDGPRAPRINGVTLKRPASGSSSSPDIDRCGSEPMARKAANEVNRELVLFSVEHNCILRHHRSDPNISKSTSISEVEDKGLLKEKTQSEGCVNYGLRSIDMEYTGSEMSFCDSTDSDNLTPLARTPFDHVPQVTTTELVKDDVFHFTKSILRRPEMTHALISANTVGAKMHPLHADNFASGSSDEGADLPRNSPNLQRNSDVAHFNQINTASLVSLLIASQYPINQLTSGPTINTAEPMRRDDIARPIPIRSTTLYNPIRPLQPTPNTTQVEETPILRSLLDTRHHALEIQPPYGFTGN